MFSREGSTRTVRCFPTKAAEWQHCFVSPKRWSSAYIPQPSVSICVCHELKTFLSFCQIIPNCDPVLQRTCSFFYLCVNGTPKKSSLGPVFSKLLPSFVLATFTQHVRETRWTTYSWEEGEGLTPPSPKSGEPPIPSCCNWANLYWVFQE